MIDQWISRTLILGVAASLVSIFLSQLVFLAAALLWVGSAYRRKDWRLQAPPFFGFVLLFLAAVLLSILGSGDVWQSSIYLKKTVKLFYVLLFFTFLRPPDLGWGLRLLCGVLAVGAVWGILEYFWLKDVDLLHRIDGLMSHWMTYAGQLMMVSLVLAGHLLWAEDVPEERRRRLYLLSGLGLLGLFGFALLLTMTRSALGGLLVGLLLMLAIWSRRVLALAGAAAVLGFFLLPGHFQSRMLSSFDLTDMTTRGRLEYIQAGANAVAAHPVTGVGPRMFPRVFDQYRVNPEFPDWSYQHLHNNLVHIAAEMGIPAMLAWLALWIKIYWDLIAFARSPAHRFARCWSISAICVLTAFLFAGLFEYNFGDSELLILLLFLVTAPYVAQLRREQPA